MIWKRLRRWQQQKPSSGAGPTAAQAAAPAPAPPAPAAAGDLASPAIERLAEDESLRGDLTDDGYLPLQSWAFAALERLAGEVANGPDPQAAMQEGVTAIRATVRSAVQAAASGTRDDLLKQIQPPVVPERDAPAVLAALHDLTLTADANANARAIAAALTGQTAH